MSEELRRLITNFASLVSGWLFVRLLGAAATMVATRLLAPAEFGILSFGIAIALVMGMGANFGLDDLIVRDVARRPESAPQLLGDAFVAKVVVFPLIFLITGALMAAKPAYRWLFLLLSLHSLLHSYLILIGAIFRGQERMGYTSLLLTGQMMMIAIGSVLAVWLTGSATAVAVGYVLATGLSVAIGYGLLRKQGIRVRWRWQTAAWKPLILAALPFGMNFLVLVCYDRMALTFIALLDEETAVGWFSAVYNITLILSNIPTLITIALFPLLARKTQQAPGTIQQMGAAALKYTLVVGIGIGLCLALAAPLIVPFLFGPAYQPGILILQLLAISVPFTFLSVILIGILEATGQQHACVRQMGLALLVALPLTYGATRAGGYLGGTAVYVFNHLLLAGVLLRLVAQTHGFHLQRPVLHPLLAGLLAAAVVLFVAGRWPLPVALAVSGGMYALLLLGGGIIGLAEWQMIRRFWPTRSLPDAGATKGVTS